MNRDRALCVLLILAVSVSEASAASSHWGKHAIWDDGLAEVAVYDARRTVYGKTRTFETVLITVKEDFNTVYHAKADPPYQGKQLLSVLKLNRVSEIQTENYPYRYLTSVFVDRNDVNRLVKMTMGSQEWCGNTFKEVRTWTGRHELVYHSYWDDQGDGVHAIDWDADTLLEDQLALSLRALPFSAGYSREMRILPTQISNKATHASPVAGQIRVLRDEAVEAGDTTVVAWRVEVTFGEAIQTYWFEKAGHHILVGFDSSDGRSLRLKRWARRTYW